MRHKNLALTSLCLLTGIKLLAAIAAHWTKACGRSVITLSVDGLRQSSEEL